MRRGSPCYQLSTKGIALYVRKSQNCSIWHNIPTLGPVPRVRSLASTTYLPVLKVTFCFTVHQVMMDFLKEWEQKLQIKITCSQASHSARIA